jgi:predicted nucleotidyltransferase
MPFDPLRGLEVLVDRGVRFVVIGGIAARLRGSTTITSDLDICYARGRTTWSAWPPRSGR